MNGEQVTVKRDAVSEFIQKILASVIP